MLIEQSVKFMTTMIASTSPLTDKGFNSAINTIRNFKLLPEEEKQPEDKHKDLPAGGYELAIGLFEGLEGPK